MRSGRLVGWCREVLGLTGVAGGPGRALRRRGLVRLRGPAAVPAGAPLLSLSLGAGVSLATGGAGAAAAAAASGVGGVTIYASIDEPAGITAGPDGTLWFTNEGNNTIGRITTAVTPEIARFTPGLGRGRDHGDRHRPEPVGRHRGRVRPDCGRHRVRHRHPDRHRGSLRRRHPPNAAAGRITVSTPAGTATSPASFTVTAPAPANPARRSLIISCWTAWPRLPGSL
jgi:hypothetical protein